MTVPARSARTGAARPTLTFDVAAADYFAAETDPLNWVNLNLPSIDAIQMPGEVVTTRYGLNVSGFHQTFTASTTAPAGASIDVTSPSWGVNAGGTLELDVTISGEDLPDGQYFGSITLDPASNATEIFIPVAFIKTQGDVTLTHSCDPTSIATGASAACTVAVQNFSPNAANVGLSQLCVGVTSPCVLMNTTGMKISVAFDAGSRVMLPKYWPSGRSSPEIVTWSSQPCPGSTPQSGT